MCLFLVPFMPLAWALWETPNGSPRDQMQTPARVGRARNLSRRRDSIASRA